MSFSSYSISKAVSLSLKAGIPTYTLELWVLNETVYVTLHYTKVMLDSSSLKEKKNYK